MMKDCKKRRRLFYLRPLLVLAVIALFSLVIMVLWNWLVPSIFGLTAINFGQALGLFVLCRLLFGRIGPGRRGRHHGGFRKGNPMTKNWMQMSSEERKEFIRKRKEWHKHNHPFFHQESSCDNAKEEDTASEKPKDDD